MISPEDKKLMVEAINYSDNNPEITQLEQGYASALKAMLVMLTNRSNTQRYCLGQDSLSLFHTRQRKLAERHRRSS